MNQPADLRGWTGCTTTSIRRQEDDQDETYRQAGKAAAIRRRLGRVQHPLKSTQIGIEAPRIVVASADDDILDPKYPETPKRINDAVFYRH